MSTTSNGTWGNWEEELYETKRKLSAEIEGMTPEERVAYINAKTEPIIKEFHMKTGTLQPVIPRVHRRIGEEVLIRYE